MNHLQALRSTAADLGGLPLTPKKTAPGKTSLAFTFRDRTKAEELLGKAKDLGISLGIKSTYRAWLVTGEI